MTSCLELAIGGFAITFARLEHEIIRAAISLLEENNKEICNKTLMDAVGKNFSERLKYFEDVYKNIYGSDEWIDNFLNCMRDANSARNHFLHGKWEELENGKVRCIFYSRRSIRNGGDPIIWEGDCGDLEEMSNANLQNITILNRL